MFPSKKVKFRENKKLYFKILMSVDIRNKNKAKVMNNFSLFSFIFEKRNFSVFCVKKLETFSMEIP